MRPTAASVVRAYDLTGRLALCTGGNAGLGLETCRALADAGARVLLTSRDLSRGKEAAAGITAGGKVGVHSHSCPPCQHLTCPSLLLDCIACADGHAHGQGHAEALQLDLCDLSSVKACAEAILAHEQRLDYVILNAGAGRPLQPRQICAWPSEPLRWQASWAGR